ncbi:MAG TPA: helix-turn-helix domain-containing protein [Puia sp.]|jgi:antitoxin component HigA of HigAB toxin-antitoxin module|nr:helix-turn-helix domain-containing protein [Puia sp.]
MKVTNRHEYFLAMAEIEALVNKGSENLTPVEEAHYGKLAEAVEAWEMKEFPMPFSPSVRDILLYIMRQQSLTQTAIAKVLDISNSALSEILSGKKKPNLDLAKQLHNKFHIDGNLILESL